MRFGKLFILFLLLTSGLLFSEAVPDSVNSVKPMITMLELGSTSCVPCKMMEPVMESLREKYGEQIEIVFYDVKQDKELVAKWQVRMIPTQVFLDEEGKEIHRHIGFYPEEQIDEFLKEQGLVVTIPSEED